MNDRYTRLAIALHWLIALALLFQMSLGFRLDFIPRGTPDKGYYTNLHKSIGLLLAAAIVLRLGWRLAHPPPPLPATMPRWQAQAAHVSHVLLYVLMLTMPLSGYIASNFSKHGVKFFGNPLPPWGPDLPQVYAIFNGVHNIAGFLLVVMIVLHVGAALKHALIDRDGVFSRMWPSRSR